LKIHRRRKKRRSSKEFEFNNFNLEFKAGKNQQHLTKPGDGRGSRRGKFDDFM